MAEDPNAPEPASIQVQVVVSREDYQNIVASATGDYLPRSDDILLWAATVIAGVIQHAKGQQDA